MGDRLVLRCAGACSTLLWSTVLSMSKNVIELLVRRSRTEGAPTALDVLKDAVEDHGQVTDDDRRRAAALTGMPEAAVYGVSTLLRRPDSAAGRASRPRVHRHRLLGCRLRRARRERQAGVRAGLRHGHRRRCGLAGRDRVPRLLPRQPGVSRRRSGRRRRRRARARAGRRARWTPPSRSGRAHSTSRCCYAKATFRAATALLPASPEELLADGQGGQPARSRRRRASPPA